ncbi:hypothetical protein H0H93_011268 [Arthromyces matolae]|nr:hypothetical protein H0H93_011268 [Arthromyces matolae]
MATSRLHTHPSLPAPVLHAGFSVPQSKSHVLAGVQDAYWSDDEALAGASIPMKLWNLKLLQLKSLCLVHVSVLAVYFANLALSLYSHKRLTQQKKQRERERKELENLGRRHLANVRVVQRNVAYVVGIGPRFAKEELISTLRSSEYFGQYGKITKIILVKRTSSGGGAPVVGLYITYHRREDAARAIAAVDGAPSTGGARGEVMRASYGTTKYCMAFLRGVSCGDHNCMNLHEWGDEKDCFTKEDLTTLKHTMKSTESRGRTTVVTQKKNEENDAGLPRGASWAQKPTGLQTSSVTIGNHMAGSTSRQPRRGGVVRQPRNPIASDNRPSASRSSHQEQKTTKTITQPSSRPTSPVPNRITSPDAKDTKEKSKKESVPQSQSPDISSRADGLESGPSSVVSPSPAPRSEPADSPQLTSAKPPLPPGLPAVPPGLSAPPGIPTPIRAAYSQGGDISHPDTPILASQSSYQMSTAARALLDDVKARREAAFPTTAGISPFPDFDRTLQTLSGGDGGGFSFNLDPKLAGSDLERSLPDFELEANVPFRGSYIDTFPALRAPSIQTSGFGAPPGLPYPSNRPSYDLHPQRSSSAADSQSSSGPSYVGSFNPFADAADDVSTSAPPLLSQTQNPLFDDENRKVSRFGFARGKQSSTATSSPLHVPSPLSNGGNEYYIPTDGVAQGLGRAQWQINGRDYGFAHPTSNITSPFVQHTPPEAAYSSPQSQFQPPTFENGVSEAQLRDFIHSSRSRAQSSLGHVNEEHLLGVKPNPSSFQDPAIMSARFASSAQDIPINMPYGPPPGLSYPHQTTNVAMSVMGNGLDGSGSTQVSATASPSLSLALSSTDFPALTASPVETSSREEIATPEDPAASLDPKAREKAERKAAKKAAAAEKAAERQRIAQEKAVLRAAERAKLALEKQMEKERALLEKEKAQAIKIQEKAAKEQAEKDKVAKAKAEAERLAKEREIQAVKERQKEKEAQVKKKQIEEKRQQAQLKQSRPNNPSKIDTGSSNPELQVPLLSKKPKKTKPMTKPIKILKDEGTDECAPTPSASTPDAHIVPPETGISEAYSPCVDRTAPTSVGDLLEEIDIMNPAMDLANHPFFDVHRLSPAATVPLEYGPLVHALSALSVGGGSFANHMPSGSIDNAVSSFQQLLETLTQTISDLLRLLPRTTWDDSSSFDGVLRDMLKGDDFLDEGADEAHGKDDEVAALTLALERRARWMEVQLSKLEELHRDINMAAVRAVLSFNDNGWDRHAFLPRVGDTLRQFDNLGFHEAKDGSVQPLNVTELERELAFAKDLASASEEQVRDMMKRMLAVKPISQL